MKRGKAVKPYTMKDVLREQMERLPKPFAQLAKLPLRKRKRKVK